MRRPGPPWALFALLLVAYAALLLNIALAAR